MKAEQLRKAILQMAIQGKLVPQDPNDEPASVLLEKIHAEKQRLIKEGKIKKDKVDSVIFKGEDNRHYEKVGNNAPICIEEELPFEIPDSWEWVRLGNAFTIVMGQSPNGNSVSQNCNGIEFHQGKICFGEKYLRVSKQKTTMPTKIIKEDAVVLCVRAPVGKVNIVERTICIGRGLCAVMPFVLMPIEFIYLLLQTYEEIFNKKATGTTFKAISNEVIFNQIIPLPPLAEQSRIVAEIEKYEPLIAEYDKLEQQKSKLDSEIYDKLKKSILQYAIQGKLVPQDENDEPASELLKRIRAEKKVQLGKKYVDSYIYKGDDNCYYEHNDGKVKDETIDVPFNLPNNWVWVRIPEITYFQEGPGIMAKDFRPQGIPLIRIAGMQTDKVSLSGCNYLDKDMVAKKWDHFRLDKGDIVISTSASMDKIAEVHDDTIGAIPYTGLIRFKMKDGLIKAYFKYFIQSDCYIKQIDEQKSGTTIQHYGPTHIQRMVIPIPPLNEQRRIVNKINEIFAKL